MFVFLKKADIRFGEMLVDSYLMNWSIANWVTEEYNVVILSALYNEPPILIKMLQTFSLNIWIFILITILTNTIFLCIKNKLKGRKNN